jgi:dienelactone hydrolase
MAQAPTPGKNLLPIRGQQQEIYFYPAAPGSPQPHPKILFAPGDFGMWGFAVTMARTMASWGYDVYGLDTKRYLESFRTKTSALKETDVTEDFRTIMRWMTGGTDEKVVLVGWSEGAGLCLLAAAPAGSKNHVAGLITLGMTETNSLACRWSDLLSYVTGKEPNEPLFKSADYLAKVAPMPLFMLQASRDQYVSVETAEQLFSLAREPKRFRLIEARNHRFEGNQEELFQAIREGLQWIRPSSL